MYAKIKIFGDLYVKTGMHRFTGYQRYEKQFADDSGKFLKRKNAKSAGKRI